MWKLYTGADRANRFLRNGTNIHDDHNSCLPNGTIRAVVTALPREEKVPSGCPVCAPSAPCLFEVLTDPSETQNLAKDPAHKALVSEMAAKLADYADAIYLPVLTDDNLACYNCTFDYGRQWAGFSGPCCLTK
jgi:hypothetical protein